MARLVIRQPKNGPDGTPRFAVFSTVVDNLIVIDATRQEIVDYFAEKARQQAIADVTRTLDEVEAGNDTGWAPTWDEAVESHFKHGGEPFDQWRRVT